ncbi:Protein RRP5 [Nowakowskiella sp. JEL0078]|nr:Protein RRP5 [Nowakowskiella sp. JEL0078]
MSILGAVKQINELEIVLSLPNQLTGTVSITEISESLTSIVQEVAKDDDDVNNEAELPDLNEYFLIGQLVPCVIISIEDPSDASTNVTKRRIELSAKPDLVNKSLSVSDLIVGISVSGSISSIEDHGYVVGFGIKETSGFLNKRNVSSDLKVGQLVQCAVVGSDDSRRVIKIDIEKALVAKAVIPKDHILGYSSLKAGMLVSINISNIFEESISVSFMGIFQGTIDKFNFTVDQKESFQIASSTGETQKLKKIKNSETIEKKSQKENFRARVLYVDVENKKIGLSVLKHLVEWNPVEFSKNVEIGLIVNKAKITRIDQSFGFAVSSPEIESGYVHITRVSDTTPDLKSFKNKSTHKARVVGFDYLGGLVQLSFQKSILEKVFLRYEDIKVGTIVKAKVMKIEKYGLFCLVDDSIRSICPKEHMSDVTVTKPEVMFKIGSQEKFQVLSIDPSKKKLILTHKKFLMNSKLAMITSYESAHVGMITAGYIAAMGTYGCIVKFYGDVQGLAPMSELSEKFLKTPSEIFNRGQPVKCRVLWVDPSNRKLRVSFKLTNDNALNPSVGLLNPGELVEGRIIATLPESVLLELVPSNIRATLSKAHLSDHHEHTDRIFATLKEGEILKNLAVLTNDKKGVSVTMKPLLINLAKNKKVLKFEDLEVGMTLPGYVRGVKAEACFVAYFGDLCGYTKLHSQNKETAQIGQTFITVVTLIDQEQGRFHLSLRESVCFPPVKSVVETISTSWFKFEDEYIKSLFEERESFINSTTKNKDKELVSKILKDYPIGKKVEGVINQIVPYGLIVGLQPKISGLVTSEQTKGTEEKKKGTKISAKVIDIDVEKKIIDLTMRPDLMKPSKAGEDSILSKNGNEPIDALVEVLKEDYLIVTLPAFGNTIAYAVSKTYNCNKTTSFTRFRVGQKIRALITSIPSTTDQSGPSIFKNRIRLVPLRLESEESKKNLSNRISLKDPIDPNVSYLQDVTIGLQIKAKVKSVKGIQVNLDLATNLKGRIHISEIADDWDSFKIENHLLKHPLARLFKAGSVIDCKVVGFRDSKTYNYLPFSNASSSNRLVIELSVKPSELNPEVTKVTSNNATNITKYKQPVEFSDIQIGDTCVGFVSKIQSDAIWVSISPSATGRVLLLNLTNDPHILNPKRLKNAFPIGCPLLCNVIGRDDKKHTLDLKVIEDVLGNKMSESSNLTEGAIVMARITKVDNTYGLGVQIGAKTYGRVHLTDISDNFKKNPTKKYSVGMFIKCYILEINKEKGTFDLSTRSSKFNDEEDNTEDDEEMEDVESDDEDDEDDEGSKKFIVEMGDSEEDNDGSENELVESENESEIDEELEQIEEDEDSLANLLSKQIAHDQEMAEINSVVDLKPDSIVRGYVKNISDKGVFVSLGRKVVARVKIAEISDAFVKDWQPLFKVGQLVRGRIIRFL